jgi:hypothetical protein
LPEDRYIFYCFIVINRGQTHAFGAPKNQVTFFVDLTINQCCITPMPTCSRRLFAHQMLRQTKKILCIKSIPTLNNLILSVTSKPIAGTLKKYLNIFSKDGKYFPKLTQKDIFEMQPAV